MTKLTRFGVSGHVLPRFIAVPPLNLQNQRIGLFFDFANWTHKDHPPTEKAKTVLSAEKGMATVLGFSWSFVIVDYFEEEKTINGEDYANLLQQLSDKIKFKRPHLPVLMNCDLNYYLIRPNSQMYAKIL